MILLAIRLLRGELSTSPSVSVPVSQTRRHGLATTQRLLPLLCFLCSCLIGLELIATKAYPSAFDELEHISYAAFLQETGRLLPKFEQQRTLAVDDMSRWDDRANYLGHPSPFYLFQSLFLDRTLEPERAILLPRLASAALLFAGVALSVWAGWRQFRENLVALSVFCLALALCPKLLAVAGQVTNDSLAFLGGALAYAGASTAIRRHRAGLAAVALGLTFALWSKPNAGLVVGVWLCAFVAFVASRPRGLLKALAAGFALGAIPYWFIVRDYGAFVPVTVEQFGNVPQLDGLGSYLPAFLFILGSSWSFSPTGGWPISPATIAVSGLFWLMVACITFGGALARRRSWEARDAIAAAAPVALALVLPIHLWFSATKLGYSLPAASFRYYLPLWPALAHALAYGIATTRIPWHRVCIVSLSAAALLVGWISP